MNNTTLETLISEAEVQRRVSEIGEEIRKDIPEGQIVLLGVLKGSFPFLADLCRKVSGDVVVDFVQISSYGEEKSSSGVVQIKKDHDINIEGKHVIIVEDIVDTGLTLKHLIQLLTTRHPASLKVASILAKPEAMKHKVPIDYLGFEIPNAFVVGYGLDYAERYRQLPYVAILKEEDS